MAFDYQITPFKSIWLYFVDTVSHKRYWVDQKESHDQYINKPRTTYWFRCICISDGII